MFRLETDDESQLKHCFGVDFISQKTYTLYSDVIVFDTIYNTNWYSMIFAPLIGINNHDQIVTFICAYLGDEEIPSFIQLFEQYEKFMPRDDPKMIITNQDPSMTSINFEMLPNTFHKYCIWYILNKFSLRLNAVEYRDYFKDFQKCT